MNTMLDDYALISPLRHSNNYLKLIVVATGLLFGVSATSPVTPLFIALCMSFAIIVFAKVPVTFYVRLIMLPLGFAATGSIIILFFFGMGIEIAAMDIAGHHLAIGSQGLNMAVLVMARTLSGMFCLFFLALTTPMVELFSVLRSSRVPAVIIELSMLVYRYIFVLLEVAASIQFAQTVRLGYRDILSSLRSTTMLAGTLFIRSWEQGEKLYLAMNSRCYDGKLGMFCQKNPLSAPELLITSLYIVSLIALFMTTENIPAV
ncbi:MAG: cobalt ECF transporter T component CbiQ [ANME-2 cluster archaeon]|nr:cobalt ECF transporter T component CbiQ [ANME-2 cluster archaeon]